MHQIRFVIASLAVSLLAACSPPASAPVDSTAPDYEIAKSGIVKEENKHSYDSPGDTTFSRTQLYKVRRVTKGKEKESRLLFLRYVLKVGATPDPACTYTTLGDTPLTAAKVVFK